MSETMTLNEEMALGSGALVAPETAGKGVVWSGRLGTLLVTVAAVAALLWPAGSDKMLVVDVSGEKVALASQLAPVTMVHFWATWCAPCIDEVPAIQRLAEDYANNRHFALVMVAVQDDPDAVKEFLGDRFQRTFFDNQWQVARRFGTEKVPETFLLVNGEVVERFIGAKNWDESSLRSPIEEALRQVGG
jgi:thiol-disulfide isomerase/thioredoxin